MKKQAVWPKHQQTYPHHPKAHLGKYGGLEWPPLFYYYLSLFQK